MVAFHNSNDDSLDCFLVDTILRLPRVCLPMRGQLMKPDAVGRKKGSRCRCLFGGASKLDFILGFARISRRQQGLLYQICDSYTSLGMGLFSACMCAFNCACFLSLIDKFPPP
jgi:hypothetical protein